VTRITCRCAPGRSPCSASTIAEYVSVPPLASRLVTQAMAFRFSRAVAGTGERA
jgi:hypothetical protein